MKLTLEQAEKRFGHTAICKLTDMNAEATDRYIYPSLEPEHVGMSEYVSGGVNVEGGVIYAYYFQPENAEEWEFGVMNGIEYGDIEFIEFIENN
jgi:hypothetical protein